MKKASLTIIAYLFLIGYSYSQGVNLEWAHSFGAKSHDRSYFESVDSHGNLYVVGNFMDTVDFDPSIQVTNLISRGYHDSYIQKLTPSGALLWAKRFGGYGLNFTRRIIIDNKDNIIIYGYYEDTLVFDDSSLSDTLFSKGGYEGFVLKIDNNGSLIWLKTIGSGGTTQANFLGVDKQNNILVCGMFMDTVDFNPGTATNIVISNGSFDAFVVKLDSYGNFIWLNTFGGLDWDEVLNLTLDQFDNIYISGNFAGQVDFDSGSGINNISSQAYQDAFVQKLNSQGGHIWTKTYGGSFSDYAFVVKTDDFNNLYVGGQFYYTVDFDPGTSIDMHTSTGADDYYIQKLDTNGNLLWVKTFGGTGNDKVYDMGFDDYGNLYAVGIFENLVDFDPDTSSNFVSSRGGYDVFIQKLDSNGNFVWVKTFGGIGNDYLHSLELFSNNQIYLSGQFDSILIMDSSLIGSNLISNGGYDAFTIKLSHCSNQSYVQNIISCKNYTWKNTGQTYFTSGTYFDSLVSADGCDSIFILNLNIIGTLDSITQVNGILSSSIPGAIYQWLDCNNSYSIISGAINQHYAPTTNGVYTVEVTKSNCVDTAACYSISNVDIKEHSALELINVYPNPTTGSLNINLNKQGTGMIYIRNVLGQILLQHNFTNTEFVSFDIDLPSSVYFIDVICNGKKLTNIKLIKY